MCVALWLDFCCCFVLFYSYGFGGSEDICSLCMLRLVKNLLEPSFSFPCRFPSSNSGIQAGGKYLYPMSCLAGPISGL